MKQLIINADDLGICESANDAIRRSFVDGVLTSTSLMAVGPSFEHAVETVINPLPELGLGLHVCLTSGHCRAPVERVPLLVDERGCLCRGFLALYRLSRTQEGLQQLETEITAQFERLADAGVVIDHVNSHRHVHMIPGIFALLVKVAESHGCRAVRISAEPIAGRISLLSPAQLPLSVGNLPKKAVLDLFSKRAKAPVSCQRIFGILGSGKMDVPAMNAVIDATGNGINEVITHPGESENILNHEFGEGDHKFWKSPYRRLERDTLLDPSLKSRIAERGIELCRYRDVTNTLSEAPNERLFNETPPPATPRPVPKDDSDPVNVNISGRLA